ncbi:putative dTDP-glucose 4-6-dehydratase domain protein, partial [Vibrio parahaemolyticus V-223/04]
TQENLQVFG